MKFYGKIVVYRYEDRWSPEKTEIFADYLEVPSIQSAKAKLTKRANTTVLFSWTQNWDGEVREYKGKDLRWKNWAEPIGYTQEDGTPVLYAYRRSESQYGEVVHKPEYSKYGKSVDYAVDLSLHWRNTNEDSEMPGV